MQAGYFYLELPFLKADGERVTTLVGRFVWESLTTAALRRCCWLPVLWVNVSPTLPARHPLPPGQLQHIPAL
jgi:hypothetical protein